MPGICVAQPGFIDLLGCLGSERQQPGLHLPRSHDIPSLVFQSPEQAHIHFCGKHLKLFL